MRTRATFTHPHPQIGATTSAHLVISLHGDETATKTRPNIAVVPVVDRSGSMASGNKLGLVTTALRHLSGYLGDQDRLGLVTFDDRIETPVATQAANTIGVAAFTHALNQLHPRGSTNLHDAIAAGVVAASRTSADTLTRIIVLTDGRANLGPTSAEALTAVLAERPAHVSVSFLGVGNDCDHTLLGHLAEQGGGTYGFIETAADAPGVLGAEVGGLLDAEAHQIQVRVTPKDRYLTFSSGAPLAYPGHVEDGTMVFDVAQVLRGVTRNIVIPVTLTGAGKAHARPVTCANINITGIIDGETIEVTLKPKVKFTSEPGDLDSSLAEIVDLAKVAAAVEDARTRADAGDYNGARDLFARLGLTSPTASRIASDMSSRYASAHTYNAAAADLSSLRAMSRGSLTGSSQEFTTLASNTIGGYYSAGQRQMAAETTTASLSASSTPATPPNNSFPDLHLPTLNQATSSNPLTQPWALTQTWPLPDATEDTDASENAAGTDGTEDAS